MANPLISVLKIGSTSYEIKDAWARQRLGELSDALYYAGALQGGDTGAYGALTPAASKGAYYKVSRAGKIDGVEVEVGDVLICNTDDTPAATSSNYGTVVANWDFINVNIPNLGALATKDSATGVYTVPTIADTTGDATITPAGSVALSTTNTAAAGDVTVSISGTTGKSATVTVTPTITSTQTGTGANFTPSGTISSSTSVVTTITALTNTTSYLSASATQGTKSTASAITDLGTASTASAVTSVGSATANFINGVSNNATIAAVTEITTTAESNVPKTFGTTSFITAITPSSATVVASVGSNTAAAITASAIQGTYTTATETLELSMDNKTGNFVNEVTNTTLSALTGLGTPGTASAYSSIATSVTLIKTVSVKSTDTAIKSLTLSTASALTAITPGTGDFVTGYTAPTTAAFVTSYGNPTVTLTSNAASGTGRIGFVSAVSGAVATTGTVSSTFTGSPFALTVSAVTVPEHDHSFSDSKILHATFSGTASTHSHGITVGSATANVTVS